MPVTYSSRQKTLVVTGSLPDNLKPPAGPQGEGVYDWSYAPPSWLERAKRDGLYDFMGKIPYYPLICICRGKLLCLAAGPYALVISLALETNVVGMPTSTYRSIIINDIPGPNANHGEELRVFRLPPSLVEPRSNASGKDRTIRIVAAFASEDWTWVINDFTSLVRMHLYVKSDGIWTENMLRPFTEVLCFTSCHDHAVPLTVQ